MRLHAADATTVARAITLRAHRGDLPGIPSSSVLRFSRDGGISIEGPVAAGRSVERAARLLDEMLPGFDVPAELRVPGGLRLVIARGLGTLELPPYGSLDEFAESLARFSAPDARSVVIALYQSWSAAAITWAARSEQAEPAQPQAEAQAVGGHLAAVPQPASETATRPHRGLTISDVRRARRSTGLTLAEISERSRIPVSLLRELEWGYFVNWPGGSYGHAQLMRYARAAGLDDEVVMSAVWPVLEDAVRIRAFAVRIPDRRAEDRPERERAHETGERGAPDTSLVRIGPRQLEAIGERRAVRRHPAVIAAAIGGLVTIGLVPAMWPSSGSREPEPVPSVETASPARERAGSQSGPASIDTPINRRRGAAAYLPASRVAPIPVSQPEVIPSVQPASLEAEAAFSPAFATAGSAAFYDTGEGAGGGIIRADSTATGAVLRVTSVVDDNGSNFHARPSPDGRTIAFDSNRDGERAVYVADENGQGVRRVTGPGFAAVPSWAPDGRRLAYVQAEPDQPNVWNLWTVDLGSGETARITSHAGGRMWGAAWFPDGDRIAYSHEGRLIVRSTGDTTQRLFPSPRRGHLLGTPAISPDGRRLVFQVQGDGAWLLDLIDGSMTRILTDATAEEFTWSRDGRQVAYHSRKTGDWGIWVMAAR